MSLVHRVQTLLSDLNLNEFCSSSSSSSSQTCDINPDSMALQLSQLPESAVDAFFLLTPQLCQLSMESENAWKKERLDELEKQIKQLEHDKAELEAHSLQSDNE